MAGRTPPRWQCPPCRRRPPPYDPLLAIWHYQPPLDAVMAGLKFRRLDYLGSQLGRVAFEWLQRGPWSSGTPVLDMVVPVPLHWSRRWMRGYNQATLIAEPIAAGYRIPVVKAVRRRRRTVQQTRLDRVARLVNPRDAFAVRRRHIDRIAGRTVLIVDDVVTTGATLAAVAATLRRAGARHVMCLALARTA